MELGTFLCAITRALNFFIEAIKGNKGALTPFERKFVIKRGSIKSYKRSFRWRFKVFRTNNRRNHVNYCKISFKITTMISDEINLGNLVDTLLILVPEFGKSQELDMSDEPGIQMTFFTIFLNEQINEFENHHLLDRCANLLDLMAQSTDISIIDILGTMVLLGLYDESSANLEAFLSKLNKDTIDRYNLNVRHWTGKT